MSPCHHHPNSLVAHLSRAGSLLPFTAHDRCTHYQLKRNDVLQTPDHAVTMSVLTAGRGTYV